MLILKKSIEKALEETARRRIKQINFNKINNIKPTSTSRKIEESINKDEKKNNFNDNELGKEKTINELKKKC